MPRLDVNLRAMGPMFDGRAARAAREYVDEVEFEVAKEALRMVQARLRRVLRNPTGYYQSRVRVDPAGSRHVVHDSGVVYGPWLEGTGSRNYPVTRFRGYATFRRTQALIQRQARQIAQRIFARYRGRF
ncbi:hypothetical protein RM572_00370 [Streptomyces sp. DSM 42041]|uniref:HK97 gp10 family phage protein n=1 Tax=Streptomyces hazeniae TaxID=3075538 RepID=A0ABU2NKE1_9ACTN|nr:hypothetical protein [Streptomyces sp. DSM 42041]MDT0377230.1 hypothetical protein [Streptomyces sp. DSM 42041]